MIVSDTAVKNRISVVVLAIMILAFGIYCYSVLPRESEPDISIPYVFVSTTYKGVSSEDIETSITIPIEKKLKGLDGLKKLTSSSAEGVSQINIEFTPETNIDDALQDVKDKVDEAQNDLPGDLEDDPLVFEVNFSELPIVVLSLSGPTGAAKLKEIADDLADDIESINGVLEAEVTGGLEREIKVEVDPDKLAYYRIPIVAIQNAVSSENQNTSGGTITLGDGRYQLRVPGEFDTPDEIFNLVVTTLNGQPVYLKDVARVVDDYKDETSRARLNSHEAVNIAVKKRSGENIIAITDQIDQLIERFRPTWPEGTKIIKLMDKAKDTRLMVADLENNILSGLVLVIVVLFFAMGFRNAALVSLAIPFSMFLSFIVLFALDITLNNMVLFSLTLALGMLVDNAIVIIENIYRYMQQGVPRIEAAMKATSEVAYPVIGSTLTTLAAFSPMLFWKGVMGEFMRYLPMTLIITLASSLVVGLIINPALTSYLMKIKLRHQSKPRRLKTADIARAGERPVEIKGPVLRFYAAFLRGALKHRFVVMGSSFAILIILFQIWLLVVGLEKPVEFFPNFDPRSAYVNIDPPEGADLDYLDRLAKKIEMAVTGELTFARDANNGTPPETVTDDLYLKAYRPKRHVTRTGKEFYGPSDLRNIEHVYAKSVETAGSSVFGDNLPNHIGIQFVDFDERARPSAQDLEMVRERIKAIAGADITVDQAQEGPPTGAPINIEIAGDDFQVLGRLAKEIRQIVSQIPFVEDVRDNYIEGIPSVRVAIDRQKAALFELSTSNIGFALKTAYNGLEISTYREGDEDFDITVTLSEANRNITDVLYKLMIPTPTGQVVPLTTIAKLDYVGSVGNIVRIDHERVVTVKANVDETKIPGAVARTQAEELLKSFVMPPGYKFTFTGENEFQKESEEFLRQAFVVALFLIFLILVTLFNSVIQPAIILSSVVLSLGGAFLGLTVIKSPFGIIMSGIGVISLAGVVVNNAIVLIDYTNKLRDRGYELVDAIVAAGATRLRPVMLTAITTILGIIPMVTGISFNFRTFSWSMVSESTQWWQTMAIVVIFGLMVATFLTLVVVPTLYSLLASLKFGSNTFVQKAKTLYWKPLERWS